VPGPGGTYCIWGAGFGPGGGGGGGGNYSTIRGGDGGYFGGGTGGGKGSVTGTAGSGLIVATFSTRTPPAGTNFYVGKVNERVNDFFNDLRLFYNIQIIGVDPAGNSYVVMTAQDVVWTMKLSSTGSVVWARSFIIAANVIFYGDAFATIDSSYNVYISVAGTVPAVGSRVFIVKYNSSGVIQWQRQATNSGYSGLPQAMCVDSNGDVWVFGRDRIGANTNKTFALKYSPSGGAFSAQYSWNPTGGTEPNIGIIAAADNAGGIYLSMAWADTSGYPNVYVYNVLYKFNTSMVFSWGLSAYLSGSLWAYGGASFGVTTDSSANVYWGNYHVAPTGSYSRPSIYKYNSSGTRQWSVTDNSTDYQNSSYQYGNTLQLDASGNVYATIVTGGTYLKPRIWKVNSSGTSQYMRSFTGLNSNGYDPVSTTAIRSNYYLIPSYRSFGTGGAPIVTNWPLTGLSVGAHGPFTVATPTTNYITTVLPSSTSGVSGSSDGSWSDAAGTGTDSALTLTSILGAL
jgi:hypothetical protein